MNVKGKWKRVLLGFWVVMVLVFLSFVLVWISRIELTRQQLRISTSVAERLLLMPWFLIPLEEKPSSKVDAPLLLEGNIVSWLFLNHLTLQDVSSPVTGLPRGGKMTVLIIEESVFFDRVSPGKYRLEVGFDIHPALYHKDMFDSLRVRGRPPRVQELPGILFVEWCLRLRGTEVILSNAGEVGSPEKLREFDPSEFVGLVVKRWDEAVPVRWALLDPFPVAQLHEFDERGWYRSVGYYRRGEVPERVVVHLYSSEGDLLMSVRTQKIKPDGAREKPQRP